MASVSSIVYRTQDTFRELTGDETWHLDVPRWVPAAEVDKDRDDKEEATETETTALEELERELGL